MGGHQPFLYSDLYTAIIIQSEFVIEPHASCVGSWSWYFLV